MCTVEQARERLSWVGDQHVAVAIWCEKDVIGRAEDRGIKLSSRAAQEIMDIIDHKQDCSLGITWDTLDVFTDDYLSSPQVV